MKRHEQAGRPACGSGNTHVSILANTQALVFGMVVFILASIACGFSPNVLFLILARAVEGIGGALLVPGSLAIISASFSLMFRQK